MKQLLSGNDWQVSPFLPGEIGGYSELIRVISEGVMFGGGFINSVVPGDVQSDALDANLIDDINYAFNARKAEWTYQRDWVYVKRFVPDCKEKKRARLFFNGVDYACEVYLNGKWLGDHETAYEPFSFNVTDKLNYGQENCLIVIVKAAPIGECQWGFTSKVNNLKARFAYGWDWCTRLVPLGIWQDVYLVYDNGISFSEFKIVTDVDYKSSSAKVDVNLALEKSVEIKNLSADVSLYHPNGKVDKKRIDFNAGNSNVTFNISDAKLWYPNGFGEQPLYTVSATLDSAEEESLRFGLRSVVWKRTDGASEDALPYQPYINGIRIYLQGYNWTPIRQLYGRKHSEAYSKRVDYLKRAGANYIRIWGGGLLEREELYNLCDECGILIMQELFQSSATANNHPPRDAGYIDMLCRAAKTAVIQKRHHPSLISWCGGNELCFRGKYMDASGKILIDGVEGYEGKKYDIKGYHFIPLSPDYPTLASIRDVVKEFDGERMFFHTSGSGPITQNADLSYVGGAMHDVHGPWALMGPTDHYTMYNNLDMMIHHEFGCPAPASVQTIEAITPKQYLWPMDDNNPMLNYHGRMFGLGLDRNIKAFFGELNDHRGYALTGRFLQWEQTRYALEAHRRLGKKCAGSCLWHFGEPWPNIVDNCCIDAYDQVKPAYYGHMAAFKPVHLAAFYSSIIHKESFEADLSLFNSTNAVFCGSLKAEIYSLNGNLLYSSEKTCTAESYSISDKALSISLSNLPNGVFFLRQSLFNDKKEMIDCGYSVHSTCDVPYRDLIMMNPCKLEASYSGNRVEIINKGDKVVSALTLECDSSASVFFSDGCCMLLPGEKAEIELEFAGESLPDLFISGFGVPYRKMEL